MKYTVRASIVRVVGHIWWMPNVVCAMDYTLSDYDLGNARDEDGKLTRESVQGWLDRHAGDFQSVDDFEADLEDGDENVLIPWASEDGEFAYSDAMFGGES